MASGHQNHNAIKHYHILSPTSLLGTAVQSSTTIYNRYAISVIFVNLKMFSCC